MRRGLFRIALLEHHNFISDGYFEFGWLSYPLTVFYLVAFANIINLIDGLDGLAAGITAITAATIGILAGAHLGALALHWQAS